MCSDFRRKTNAYAEKVKRLQDRLNVIWIIHNSVRVHCTSLIVACELRYGTCKKGSSVLTSRVEQLLYTLPVLALEENVAQEYGEIRTALERIGQPIGGNDLLIAAHARTLRLTVVTANLREFLRVPGLAVENWLE
jgi:tRNA(fMet)-specific endonuclease VapC